MRAPKTTAIAPNRTFPMISSISDTKTCDTTSVISGLVFTIGFRDTAAGKSRVVNWATTATVEEIPEQYPYLA